MAVKIVPESEAQELASGDYVRVSTENDPDDDTVTLATIQRFVDKQHVEDAKPPRIVKTLVLKQPMSTAEALGLATRYAERKNIPVVYTDR